MQTVFACKHVCVRQQALLRVLSQAQRQQIIHSAVLLCIRACRLLRNRCRSWRCCWWRWSVLGLKKRLLLLELRVLCMRTLHLLPVQRERRCLLLLLLALLRLLLLLAGLGRVLSADPVAQEAHVPEAVGSA